MAIYNQIPGRLDIKVKNGDDVSITVNIDQSITGYTFSSYVNESTTNTFVVTALSSSSLKLEMDGTQLQNYGTGDKDWRLAWTSTGGVSRTILSGKLIIV